MTEKGLSPFFVTSGKVYRVEIRALLPFDSGRWTLIASHPSGEWHLSEFFNRRDDLEDAVLRCFCTRHQTGAETVLEAAVRQGLAERMPQPEVLPNLGFGRPWLA